MQKRNASVASRILGSLQRRLGVYVCHILVRPWSGSDELPAKDSNLRYAVLTEARVLAWCKDSALELDRRQVRSALRRGDVCIGVTEGGAPVGYVWYAQRTAPHTGDLWVQFQPGLAYAYKSFIRPECRGRGIAAELYAQGVALCPKKATHSGISFIGIDNERSLRAALRAGWRCIGYAGYASLFGSLLPFRSPGASRFGFRFCAPAATRFFTTPRETRTSAA